MPARGCDPRDPAHGAALLTVFGIWAAMRPDTIGNTWIWSDDRSHNLTVYSLLFHWNPFESDVVAS